MADPVDLSDVATELYGLPLEEFTATRDARVRQLRADGERAAATAVGGLRRPSTAAWTVNQLVRARPEEVEQLLELGAALREAQGAFAGEELRALGKQQHRLIAAVRREAQAVAREKGQRLSETVAREVEATLKAGMADVDAAAAVRSGLLLRGLQSTGFAPVDLDGAVALPDALPHGGRPRLRVVRETEVADGDPAGKPRGERVQAEKPSRAEKRARAEKQAGDEQARAEQEARDEQARAEQERGRLLAEARAELEEAETRRTRTRAALEEAEHAVDELARHRAEVRERLAELRRDLETAEREDDVVSARLTEARSARDDAMRADAAATRDVERARTRTADLTPP